MIGASPRSHSPRLDGRWQRDAKTSNESARVWWEMSFGQPKREACEVGDYLLLVCEEVLPGTISNKSHTRVHARKVQRVVSFEKSKGITRIYSWRICAGPCHGSAALNAVHSASLGVTTACTEFTFMRLHGGYIIRLDVSFFDPRSKCMTGVIPDPGYTILTPGQTFGRRSRFLTWVASPRFQTLARECGLIRSAEIEKSFRRT